VTGQFTDQEWGLLVGLPPAIVVAASAAQEDGVRATLAESEAGLAAIAAGRESGIGLVEEVAREVVSLMGDPEEGAVPPVFEFTDRDAGVADALDRARQAVEILARQADEGEAAAYRHWLVTIAEQVVSAATTGGVLGVGGELVTRSEQLFVDRLTEILQD
jgi:hypothetical protein